MPDAEPSSARALLRERDYLCFWASRWMGSLGTSTQSVAMGWQVYALSRHTLSVGVSSFNVSLIGLITFAPLLFLFPIAGETVDRYDRRRLMLICYGGEVIPASILIAAGLMHFLSVPLMLSVALIFGFSRTFFSPASTALGPMLVPRELLPRAIAWNSLAGQTASILAPVLAGALIAAFSPTAAYIAALALYIGAWSLLWGVRKNTRPAAQAGSRWTLVKEGLAYVWSTKIIFGAISLDLAAVILSGATAMLPAFARDVLKVGPEGFGLLRAAPSAGAAVVALYISAFPMRTKAGLKMFIAVGVFSLATIAFGVSRMVWLSVAALVVIGAADYISVNVRQTLVQLVTPDHMRGRVGAVSNLFISASNELGEFRGGLVARFLGPVAAVVYGGWGALGVTGLWAFLFPALRKADRLE